MHEKEPAPKPKREQLVADKAKIEHDIEMISNFNSTMDISTMINNMWEKYSKDVYLRDSFNKVKTREELLNHLEGELLEINARIEQQS